MRYYFTVNIKTEPPTKLTTPLLAAIPKEQSIAAAIADDSDAEVPDAGFPAAAAAPSFLSPEDMVDEGLLDRSSLRCLDDTPGFVTERSRVRLSFGGGTLRWLSGMRDRSGTRGAGV